MKSSHQDCVQVRKSTRQRKMSSLVEHTSSSFWLPAERHVGVRHLPYLAKSGACERSTTSSGTHARLALANDVRIFT